MNRVIKIGITGTREGMNDSQFQRVTDILSKYPKGTELHHGDCEGVDAEVAMMARELGFKIVCHPPLSDYKRAFFNSDETREKFDYLERDRNIVDSTDELIVVPLKNFRQPHSGTWYTHDYAVEQGKMVYLILPEI